MVERRRECSECVEILLLRQSLENLSKRLDSIEGKLAEAESYIDSMSEKLKELEKRTIVLEQRINILLEKISSVNEQIGGIGDKMFKLEERIVKVETDEEKIVYMDFLKNLKKMFDSAFIKIGVWSLIVFGAVGIAVIMISIVDKFKNLFWK